MDWFFSLIRIAGASFPVSSSLIQLQSEIDSKALMKRLTKLEDPISHLHENIQNVSKIIFDKMKSTDSKSLKFPRGFYKKYSRPLAILVSQKYISANHSIGNKYYGGVELTDPSYIIYLCALFEDSDKMKSLNHVVDNCLENEWLEDKSIQRSINVPLPAIESIFKIYQSKGYGAMPNEIGSCKYEGRT